MPLCAARFSAAFVLCSLMLLNGSTSVSLAQGDVKSIIDGWCGFSLGVSQPWQQAPLRNYTVPGAIRCAWSGPNGSSIVVFVQEPGVPVSPRAILDSSVKAQKESLGATVSAEEVRDIAGKQAMWMVVTGKGTGGAIDGKGATQTTQHWVAVPRQRDVLVFLLTCPAPEYARLQKSFESAVASLKLIGT